MKFYLREVEKWIEIYFNKEIVNHKPPKQTLIAELSFLVFGGDASAIFFPFFVSEKIWEANRLCICHI